MRTTDSSTEPTVRFREASAADAEAIARLHADSWRRHYRGAYADSFLDGDVVSDRIAVWGERLAGDDPSRLTILAEDDSLVGFANAYFGRDAAWGTLVDNLHVADARRRSGIGARLMALTAKAVLRHAPSEGLYLWVLEQNAAARAFYEAIGGQAVERAGVEPPGGVPGRLRGKPQKLRYAWRDPAALGALGNPGDVLSSLRGD